MFYVNRINPSTGIDNARTALYGTWDLAPRQLALWKAAGVMVVHRFNVLNLKYSLNLNIVYQLQI